MNKLPGIAFIGEPLLELAPGSRAKVFDLAVAGDVFNTAAAVAQLGVPSFLATSIGDIETDRILIDKAHELGISTKFFRLDRDHHAGLYLINNDPTGERSFTYWRSDSSARHLFQSADDLDQLLTQLADIPQWYLSGITLSLLSDASLNILLRHLVSFRRRGGTVIYDNNYRPALWNSAVDYRRRNIAVLELVDVFLPSVEDAINSGSAQSMDEALDQFRLLDVREVIVKNGTEPVTLLLEGVETIIPVQAQSQVVDTTGAGDGFNGGYLAARAMGLGCEDAVHVGMRVSGSVVCHRGAILPPETWQTLKKYVLDNDVRI